MDVFEDRNKKYSKQLIKIGGNNVLRSRSRVALFVVRFANFTSRALFPYPSGDRVMPRAEMHVRAQASHGKNTVLCHLNNKGKGQEIYKSAKALTPNANSKYPAIKCYSKVIVISSIENRGTNDKILLDTL